MREEEAALVRATRLTDAQREVLRRFHKRRTAKEIGRELGITHWAVNERLRSARRVLGVGSSGEAARLLANVEQSDTYKRVVCDPPPVADAIEHVMFSNPGRDGNGSSEASRRQAVREEQRPYEVAYHSGLGLPLPRYRGERNELSIARRLAWIGAIALGIVAMVGALITISWGVVRIVGQTLRLFA